MSLNTTPMSNRVHIGIFGRANSGKSSLINSITGQNVAIVSESLGTTTDPVYKAMEIHGIGPCVFIDTAGFDDTSSLGETRVEKTRIALQKTDIAIIVFANKCNSSDIEWINEIKKAGTPIIPVLNKIDIIKNIDEVSNNISSILGINPVLISAKDSIGVSKIKEELLRNLPKDYEIPSITAHMVNKKEVVMLVMPQDIQAPKGRLILPQVQTIRDLLDNKCIVISTTTDNFEDSLLALKKPPKLIITDSQAFKTVYDKKPKESLLTSFSILFAKNKGDLDTFIDGAKKIDNLTENSNVLIAEACTHAPLEEDIGRVKIPNMLRKKVGKNLNIDIVSGIDFPEDLTKYDLIIHCGSCMFNKKYVMSRIKIAKQQNVPISNYGVVLAKLTGILNNINF